MAMKKMDSKKPAAKAAPAKKAAAKPAPAPAKKAAAKPAPAPAKKAAAKPAPAPAKKAAAKSAPAPAKKAAVISEAYTKAQILTSIAEDTGLSKKQVTGVFDALNDLIGRHLKGRGAGTFTIPGLAKIGVTKKPATKARKGVNPFTGQEIMIAAKPARRAVRVRPLKGLKGMVD